MRVKSSEANIADLLNQISATGGEIAQKMLAYIVAEGKEDV